MGDLADEFDAFQRAFRRGHGPTCAVGDIIQALDEADRAAFLVLVDDRRIYGTSLAARLRDIADRLPSEDAVMARLFRACGSASVQRHRRGECRCERDG